MTEEKKPVVLYKKIGSFSGPVINGKTTAFVKAPTIGIYPHLLRAFWLTSMTESGGKLGTVMMADGTGCTTGLDQIVAVYPKNLLEQGPLFKLIHRMDAVAPVPYYLAFSDHGWFLADDGVLRKKDGSPVHPIEIRNVLTPPNGRVIKPSKPKETDDWTQSKLWALMFHALFSLDQTRVLQIKYGTERITKTAKRYKSKHIMYKTIEELCYKGEVQTPFIFDNEPALDLAMCIFWNYFTNAPTPALSCLRSSWISYKPDARPIDFSVDFIKRVRSSRYCRWGDNRYDRTRQHALSVWPKELFEGDYAIMPARKVRNK